MIKGIAKLGFFIVLSFNLFIGCNGTNLVEISKNSPKARTTASLKGEPSIKGIEKIPDYAPGVDGKISYDSDRDRLVFVSYFPVQTWEFVGDKWYQVFTPHTPHDYEGNGESFWYELIYYPPLKMTLMCVGFGDSYDADLILWGFDGNDWTLLSQQGEPIPKAGGVLLYDPKQQRILYTGAYSNFDNYVATGRNYDVWVYNTYGWNRQYIEPSFDTRSSNLHASFDYDRNIIVLTGTFRPTCTEYLHRTLEFDWKSWHVTNVDNTVYGITYYDTVLHRTVSLTQEYYSDSYQLWVYQKGNWLKLAEYEEPFSKFTYHTTYAINANVGQLFLYTCNQSILSFTREQGFSLLTPLERPLNGSNSPIDSGEYVPWLGGMVFFTPRGCGYDEPLQLWRWDHVSLTMESELEGYDIEVHAKLVNVPGTQSLLAFITHGFWGLIDVESYDGVTWTHELAYDVGRDISSISGCYFPPTQTIYLFFADSMGLKTAKYENAQITEIATQNTPERRDGFLVVYDENSGKLLLFGGIKYYDNTQYSYCVNETWEFDGETWVKKHPTTPPYPRGMGTLVFDSRLQKVLLFGGRCSSSTLSDAWAYKDGEWEKLKPLTELSQRAAFAAAYDPEQQVTMLWGGYVTQPIDMNIHSGLPLNHRCSLWELTTSNE